jgi:hypothetical protein
MAYVLKLSGSQTIREAEDTARALRDILTAESAILLDCGAIEETDLTFLQLVIAARKSAVRDGKTLALASPAEGVLLTALAQAGIRPDGSRQFWFEEGNAA